MTKYLFPLFVVACLDANKNQEKQIISDTDDPVDDGYPFFSGSELPDLFAEMDASFCHALAQEYPGVPGATSYFIGSYLLEQEEWIGKEKWVLFPNESWQQAARQQWEDGDQSMADLAQGKPCEVSWDMSVTELEVENCLSCNLAFYVQAQIQASESTCPQHLWSGPAEQQWETTYEISTNNGTSIFHFLSNGHAFGWGYSSDQAINFLSDANCKWF